MKLLIRRTSDGWKIQGVPYAKSRIKNADEETTATAAIEEEEDDADRTIKRVKRSTDTNAADGGRGRGRSKKPSAKVKSQQQQEARAVIPFADVEVFGATPVIQKNLGAELVGCRLHVYWPKDSAWYGGLCEDFDSKKGQHSIAYDDGDKEFDVPVRLIRKLERRRRKRPLPQ